MSCRAVPSAQIRQLNRLGALFMIFGLVTKTFSKTCIPVTCSRGFQIVTCDKDGEQDKCELCPQYKAQYFNISSLDERKYQRCFSFDSDSCKDERTIHSRWRDRKTTCGQPCECDVNNCYAGETACECTQYKPCGINEQMNKKTGACEPCPPNRYKDEQGCFPCLYDIHKNRTTMARSRKQTMSSGKSLPIPENKTSNSETDGSSGTTQEPLSSPRQLTESPKHGPIAKEMSDVGAFHCVHLSIAVVLGCLLFAMLVLVIVLLLKMYSCRRRSKTSHVYKDAEENKPKSFTIIQENSMLLNIKDNNTNIVREIETAQQCTEESLLKRSSMGSQTGKQGYKRTASEELVADSGFMTRNESSSSSYLSSNIILQKNSCPSENGGIPGHCQKSSLLTGTLSATEHDEESTHVKTISGD